MSKKLGNPQEEIVRVGLDASGFSYSTDEGGGTSHRLDFHLHDYDVAIEVKKMYTPRTSDQLQRHPDVIVAQGDKAVALLSSLLAQFKGDDRGG